MGSATSRYHSRRRCARGQWPRQSPVTTATCAPPHPTPSTRRVSIGFVLGSGALILGLLVLALTVLGGERAAGAGCGGHAAQGRPCRFNRCRAQLSPRRTSHPPPQLPAPAPVPSCALPSPAAPRQHRVLTPEALEEFRLSRRALLTPSASLDEASPAHAAPCGGALCRGCGGSPGSNGRLAICTPPLLSAFCLPPVQDAAERGLAAWPSAAAEAGSLPPSSPARTSLADGGRPTPVTAAAAPAPTSPAASGEVALAAVPARASQDGHNGAADGAGAAARTAFAVQGGSFSE